ncbi:hypothetical protein AVEN_38352-1 [Araneus ventricosus]|uniref:Alcohol dehydrogenase-like N-terminal domain-containing protein n=1 Tax=Araneus ventricosus TaxID=182803 RepID=A0A4Y2GUI8_ARAVE|nr:hypothetical protein AVEN_38352-1 [Araneus ventricosus]
MDAKPKTFKKLMVQKLTSNFREAVSIEILDMCHPSEGEVCIRNKYVGINATDVNVTKGRYASVGAKLPFGVGLEGLGEIVEVGENVKVLKIGQYVAYMNSKINSYAEYVAFGDSDELGKNSDTEVVVLTATSKEVRIVIGGG